MRKKKSEVDVTKQTLAQADQGVVLEPKHHPTPKAVVTTTSVSQTVAPVTDGVIDLDPATDQKPSTVVDVLVPKTKRKYTKRAKKSTAVVVTPTFVDLPAIRDARVRAFTDYIDGNKTFEQATVIDDRLKALHDLGKEIAAGQNIA